jgi:hypothetical protein
MMHEESPRAQLFFRRQAGNSCQSAGGGIKISVGLVPVFEHAKAPQ